MAEEVEVLRTAPSGSKSDQIFQLSLTEIAFTLIFILLLLLGYRLITAQKERERAEQALAQVQGAEQAKKALEGAQQALQATLGIVGAPNASEVITRLVDNSKIESERDELRQRVQDLDAQIVALTELKRLVDSVVPEKRDETLKDEVVTALTLQQEVRQMLQLQPPPRETSTDLPKSDKKPTTSANEQPPSEPAGKDEAATPKYQKEPDKGQTAGKSDRAKGQDTASSRPDSKHNVDKQLSAEEVRQRARQAIEFAEAMRRELQRALGKDIAPGQEAETVRRLTETSGMTKTDLLAKENSDLRGQVMFLRKRLEARGGRDYPPCWADESGKVEFLASIELRPDAIVVMPAWNARRAADAKALPGLQELLDGPHTLSGFQGRVMGVFDWSRKQDPQCRHYVQLKSNITDAVQSDRARLIVENYFYKVELRR
jgi:predicted Rdx family selenoprotein